APLGTSEYADKRRPDSWGTAATRYCRKSADTPTCYRGPARDSSTSYHSRLLTSADLHRHPVHLQRTRRRFQNADDAQPVPAVAERRFPLSDTFQEMLAFGAKRLADPNIWNRDIFESQPYKFCERVVIRIDFRALIVNLQLLVRLEVVEHGHA